MNEFRQRLAVWSGMIGSLLFVAVFVVEDVFSPDFNWLSTEMSVKAIASTSPPVQAARARSFDAF
jgi:hypothetical protein